MPTNNINTGDDEYEDEYLEVVGFRDGGVVLRDAGGNTQLYKRAQLTEVEVEELIRQFGIDDPEQIELIRQVNRDTDNA